MCQGLVLARDSSTTIGGWHRKELWLDTINGVSEENCLKFMITYLGYMMPQKCECCIHVKDINAKLAIA